jgi:hypothetical protein
MDKTIQLVCLMKKIVYYENTGEIVELLGILAKDG